MGSYAWTPGRAAPAASISICTWNARALLHHDPCLRTSKIAKLRELINRFDVVLLQEVHGSSTEFLNVMHWLRLTHHIMHSFHQSADTGSVVSIFSNKVFGDDAQIDPEVLVRGRVLITTISDNQGRTGTYGNIHDHGLTPQQKWNTFAKLRRLGARATNEPTGHFAPTAGDFTFVPCGEARFMLARPSDKNIMVSRGSVFWENVLADYVEIASDLHTRYDSHSDSYSRLDHIFLVVPPSMLLNIKATAAVTDDPKHLDLRRLSDHAPLITELAARGPLPKRSRPISADVFHYPNLSMRTTAWLRKSTWMLCPRYYDGRRTKKSLKKRLGLQGTCT